jgi:hypothetical protein
VHCRVPKNPPLNHTLSQLNSAHIFSSYFFNCRVGLPHTSGISRRSVDFHQKLCVYFSPPSCVLHVHLILSYAISSHCCCCCLCWSETISLNCGHQRDYCSSLWWYASLENYGGMISTGENSWFVHKCSLEILTEELSSSEAGGAGEGNAEFCLRRSVFLFVMSFNILQFLSHGADGFTSPPKRVLLRIFIALKKPPSSVWF